MCGPKQRAVSVFFSETDRPAASNTDKITAVIFVRPSGVLDTTGGRATTFFFSKNQTTVEWRPHWYRLQGHMIYYKATNTEVPYIDRALFDFICKTTTRQRPI